MVLLIFVVHFVLLWQEFVSHPHPPYIRFPPFLYLCKSFFFCLGNSSFDLPTEELRGRFFGVVVAVVDDVAGMSLLLLL